MGNGMAAGSVLTRGSDAATDSEAAPASLSVVIVSHCQPALLDRCLRSLESPATRSGSPPEVWVVDNASGPGVEDVLTRFPAVRCIANRSNLGYGAAVNLALAQITSSEVLVLNQDVFVPPGALPVLMDVLRTRPEVGVVGCRLIRPDGTEDHACRRSFPTLTGALGQFTALAARPGAPRWLAQYRAPERQGPGPVDAISGAFMLIRRRALEEVGGFDPAYWMYGEDLDLCRRVARRGWLVWYEPTVWAEHVKGACTGRHRKLRANVAFHHAMLRYYRKFEAPQRAAAVNGVVYAAWLVKTALSVGRSAAARGATRLRIDRG